MFETEEERRLPLDNGEVIELYLKGLYRSTTEEGDTRKLGNNLTKRNKEMLLNYRESLEGLETHLVLCDIAREFISEVNNGQYNADLHDVYKHIKAYRLNIVKCYSIIDAIKRYEIKENKIVHAMEMNCSSYNEKNVRIINSIEYFIERCGASEIIYDIKRLTGKDFLEGAREFAEQYEYGLAKTSEQEAAQYKKLQHESKEYVNSILLILEANGVETTCEITDEDLINKSIRRDRYIERKKEVREEKKIKRGTDCRNKAYALAMREYKKLSKRNTQNEKEVYELICSKREEFAKSNFETWLTEEKEKAYQEYLKMCINKVSGYTSEAEEAARIDAGGRYAMFKTFLEGYQTGDSIEAIDRKRRKEEIDKEASKKYELIREAELRLEERQRRERLKREQLEAEREKKRSAEEYKKHGAKNVEVWKGQFEAERQKEISEKRRELINKAKLREPERKKELEDRQRELEEEQRELEEKQKKQERKKELERERALERRFYMKKIESGLNRAKVVDTALGEKIDILLNRGNHTEAKTNAVLSKFAPDCTGLEEFSEYMEKEIRCYYILIVDFYYDYVTFMKYNDKKGEIESTTDISLAKRFKTRKEADMTLKHIASNEIKIRYVGKFDKQPRKINLEKVHKFGETKVMLVGYVGCIWITENEAEQKERLEREKEVEEGSKVTC